MTAAPIRPTQTNRRDNNRSVRGLVLDSNQNRTANVRLPVAFQTAHSAATVREPLSLRAGWVWFTLAVAVLISLLGLYASRQHGATGWIAALSAGVLCWVAGMCALAIVSRSRGPNAVSALLLAMLIRLGGPMAVGLMVDSSGGPLAQSGFFGLVVASYLVTLVVETLLMVRMIPVKSAAKAASGESSAMSLRS